MPRTKSTTNSKTAKTKASASTRKATSQALKKLDPKKLRQENQLAQFLERPPLKKMVSKKSASTKAVKKETPAKGTKTRAKKRISAKEIAKKIDKNIQPHALTDEVTEKVRELIHTSREQGYLTFKDIDQALPEIANQPDELQNVISIFNNLEIKLLDSNEVDKFKKKKEESEEETARSNQSDMLDDPVRMYLNKWVRFHCSPEKKRLIYPKE